MGKQSSGRDEPFATVQSVCRGQSVTQEAWADLEFVDYARSSWQNIDRDAETNRAQLDVNSIGTTSSEVRSTLSRRFEQRRKGMGEGHIV